jgi:glucose/arabinose dehydrogenase
MQAFADHADIPPSEQEAAFALTAHGSIVTLACNYKARPGQRAAVAHQAHREVGTRQNRVNALLSCKKAIHREEIMRAITAMVAAAAVCAALSTASAQSVPTARDQVAYPGGHLPGNPKVALVKIADGLHDPIGVAAAFDGSGRIFVVERVGRIRIVTKDGKLLDQPFLDLTKINPLGNEVQTGFVEQGLWSVAFDPDFKKNGYFYVHYSSLPFNGAGIILRVTVDPKSPDVVAAEQVVKTGKVIMNIAQPYYNHDGGMIQFGPDGYLYVSRGDGGWEGDPLNAGQDIHVLWGKILRINVHVPDDSIPYLVPNDNPFAEAAANRLMFLFGVTEEQFSHIKIGAKPEIWAYGVRNPYQFHFDKKTGDLFIADVGQNHWENVFWQPHNSKGGENYGWAINAGAHCFPTVNANTTCPQVGVLPIANYPHETKYPGAPKETSGFGCAVIGLGVANYAGLDGAYLAGDWCTGRLWAMGWDKGANKWQLQELMQTQLQFTSGNIIEDGTVVATNCYCFYTADQGPLANPVGALWRVVEADKVPAGAEVAKSLK